MGTLTAPDGAGRLIVELGEERVNSFANRAATTALNRLALPMRQALGEAEDEDERAEIAAAIADDLSRAFKEAVTRRIALLDGVTEERG